jgi:hypothetical protein
MATHSKQVGSVLLLTLIICSICSLLMLLMLETSVLQTMMMNHSLAKKNIHLQAVVKLNALSNELDDNSDVILDNFTILQWVPDTLLRNETEGILYYQISYHKMLPDGVVSTFIITHAIRGGLPKDMRHPNQNQAEMNIQHIPLSKWVPISAIVGEVLVGEHPQGAGVLLYILAKKKYHEQDVILIIEKTPQQTSHLYKVIDLGTSFYQPILRNKKLLVNDDEFVMVFDAMTGQLLLQQRLELASSADPLSRLSVPKMLVRKPREMKRLIMCPTAKGWAKAEVDIDYSILGRRTWYEI